MKPQKPCFPPTASPSQENPSRESVFVIRFQLLIFLWKFVPCDNDEGRPGFKGAQWMWTWTLFKKWQDFFWVTDTWNSHTVLGSHLNPSLHCHSFGAFLASAPWDFPVYSTCWFSALLFGFASASGGHLFQWNPSLPHGFRFLQTGFWLPNSRCLADFQSGAAMLQGTEVRT